MECTNGNPDPKTSVGPLKCQVMKEQIERAGARIPG